MAFLIDQLNNSGLFAQSAYSASIATYDSDGNIITATYLSSHQPISANEWNSSYETVQTNSGSWGGGSIDTIPIVPISPLVTGFSGDSAYMAIESSALNLSAYVPVSAITISNNYVQAISGTLISARYARASNNANTAYTANKDSKGNTITSYYQPKLTIAGQNNTITAINGSAVGANVPSGFELIAGANIAIVDDDVNLTTTISADLSNYYTKSETSGATELADAFSNIPAGDAEVNSYVQTNSGAIDETVTTVQTNSASWGQGGGAATLPISGTDSQSYTSAYYEANGITYEKEDRAGEPDIRTLYITPSWITLNATVDEQNYFGFELADDHLALTSQFDPNCVGYVNAESISSWDDTYTTYSNNSATYLTAHQAISANEWNDCYDNVQTNSASWGQGGGGSYTGDAQGALDEVYTNSGNWNDTYTNVSTNSAGWGGDTVGLSAGWGIDIQLSNSAVWISATTQPDLTYLSGSIDYVSGVVGDVESLLAQL